MNEGEAPVMTGGLMLTPAGQLLLGMVLPLGSSLIEWFWLIFNVGTICTPCKHRSLTGGFWRPRVGVRSSAMSPVFANPLSELVAVPRCFIKKLRQSLIRLLNVKTFALLKSNTTDGFLQCSQMWTQAEEAKETVMDWVNELAADDYDQGIAKLVQHLNE